MDPVSRAQNSNTSARKKVGRPFPKGTSGNPGGRPKHKPITDIFTEIVEEAKAGIKAQVIATLTSRGMAGVLMLREVADRVEGKVAQEIDVDVNAQIHYSEAVARVRARKANIQALKTKDIHSEGKK